MTISLDDFKKLEIKIGQILSVEKVPETDKLLKLSVDILDELEAVRKVYKALYKPGSIIPLREMIKFIDENPDIISKVKEHGVLSHNLDHYLKK